MKRVHTPPLTSVHRKGCESGTTSKQHIPSLHPTCNKEGSNPGVCSRCWSSRPGVATRMFIFMTDVCSSRNSFLPPVINPADSWWCFPNSRSTSKIWRDSSLVGDITSAARPSLYRHRHQGSGQGANNNRRHVKQLGPQRHRNRLLHRRPRLLQVALADIQDREIYT